MPLPQSSGDHPREPTAPATGAPATAPEARSSATVHGPEHLDGDVAGPGREAPVDVPGAAGPAGARRPPSLWRNRDYLYWWGGQAVSLLGTNVSAMAFPLLAVFSTGSLLNAGIIAAAGRIGGLLTLLWGGTLADRRSRKTILVVAPAIQAVLMAVASVSLLTGPAHIDWLAGIALLSGLANGLRSGAVLPALRRIVPAEQFASRAAQAQGVAMAAQLAGSPLAAVLFTAARWLPFAVDALSFLFASAGAALIRQPLGPDRPQRHQVQSPGADPAPDRRSVLADIKKGFQVIGRDGFLRYTTGWVAVTNLVGNSFLLLLVALLSDRGAAPELIGITNAGVLGGGIIGAMLAGAILKRLPALRVFRLGGWIYFLSLALAAISPEPWQIGLAAAVFAFTSAPMVTVWESYTVRRVPDRLTGRVLSASAFCAQSLAWIGMLTAGWISDKWGASAAALCFAAILVPFAVAGHLAKSLTLLRHPAEQIDEVSDGPGAR